ncbi:MAG: LamG-like jellyroll fold domain-containing protein [Phycisphaerales bacterium]|jgi:hypothetical protein
MTKLSIALLLASCVAATSLPVFAQNAAQPAATKRAKKKDAKDLDPDLLFQVGITAGKLHREGVTDATGKVRGTIMGNPTGNNIGPGEGFRFDGKHDWVNFGDDATKTMAGLPTRDFTVSTWVNLEATTEFGGILGCVQDTGDAKGGWVLGYTTDAFYFALSSKGQPGKLTYLKATKPIELGKWYNVAGTYDGQSMKLYVNGELQAETREQSGDIAYPKAATYAMACLKNDKEARPMAGTLLEAKVIGRALNQGQVNDEFAPGALLASYQPQLESTQRYVVTPYLQFATQDGITIMWETSRPCVGYVEYGETRPYPMKTEPTGEPTLIHEVHLSNLKTETPYFYRAHIKGEDGADIPSDDLTFQTAVKSDSPYAFTIIGDTQKNKPVIAKLQAFAYTLRPNFEIHLGDVVDKGADRDEWISELLPASAPLMGRVCLYPSIGNHEGNHSNYFKYFSLPTPEYYYTYTYGNAQFFVLDTNRDVSEGSDQYKWLEKELAKSTATWKFTYHHHPIYSSDEDDYGDTYKGTSTHGDPALLPLARLYDKYHVDMDFAGHIHSYERTWPMRDGKIDQKNGTRYMVAGGGGAGLESAAPSRVWFDQRVYRGHHIGYMMICGGTLQFQLFDVDGRLFDQFEIQKTVPAMGEAPAKPAETASR